jgi:hypothetical protein
MNTPTQRIALNAETVNSDNSPPIDCMTAQQMFQIVHGGTAGSEFEFNCLNPSVKAGWKRLAAMVTGLKLGALEVAEQKCKEACGGSAPSAGYDYFDEVCGLLRVTRQQRDDKEAEIAEFRRKLKAIKLLVEIRHHDDIAAIVED